MSDKPSPRFDFHLQWRGTVGRLRVYADRVIAETSYERDGVQTVPMELVQGWRIEPCDFDAICVEFLTPSDTWRVLLQPSDAGVIRLTLEKTLGAPTPLEPRG